MTPNFLDEDSIAKLVKNSRRYTVLSLLGIVVVIVSLLYAAAQLSSLNTKAETLNGEIADLTSAKEKLEQRAQGLNDEIDARTKVLAQVNSLITQTKNPQLIQKAQQAQVSSIDGFKIGIYFLQSNPAARAHATTIKTALERNRLSQVTVQLYPNDVGFFDKVAVPMGDEIRYETGFETVQAQALLEIMKALDSGHPYRLREVFSRTPGFISIFLQDGFRRA